MMVMMVVHHAVHHLLVMQHGRVVQLCVLERRVIAFLFHDYFFAFLNLFALLGAPVLKPDFYLLRKIGLVI